MIQTGKNLYLFETLWKLSIFRSREIPYCCSAINGHCSSSITFCATTCHHLTVQKTKYYRHGDCSKTKTFLKNSRDIYGWFTVWMLCCIQITQMVVALNYLFHWIPFMILSKPIKLMQNVITVLIGITSHPRNQTDYDV